MSIVRTAWGVEDRQPLNRPAKLFKGQLSRALADETRTVSDGLSNTLLISEKFVRSDMSDTVAPDGTTSYSDDRGWTDGWDPDTVRFTGYQPISDQFLLRYPV